MHKIVTIELNSAGVQRLSTVVRSADEQRTAAQFFAKIAPAVEELNRIAKAGGKQ